MKKYLIYAVSIMSLAWGCNSNKSDSHQEEEHIDVHDHEHEGHAHGEGEEIILSVEQAEMIGVKTEVVSLKPFYQVIKTSGQIQAAQGEERTIVATISGVVRFNKSGINEGKPVGRGESLFSISSSNLAEGDPVQKAKSAYEIAKKEFDRAEILIQDKLISQKEYNEIKLAFESAKIAYDAVAGGGRTSGANISSPIAGYIKSRLVEEGQFVNMGEPLMVVTQNNKLQLRADVSERYYKDLQAIKSANFRTPYDNQIYMLSEMSGKLISYGKAASDGYYIPVTFEFNNVGDIIPGSYVEVFLLSGVKENTIAIPLSCLVDEQGLFFVYCKLHDDEYERREVKLGASDGTQVEILSGLHEGDEVVTYGAYHVKLAAKSGAIPDSHHHH